MAQFKVGDRVRLTEKAKDALPWMLADFGAERTIAKLYERRDIGEDPLAWFEGMGSQTLDVGWLEPAPVTPLIDPAKTYQTRDGRAVRIYATDGGGEYPVHGAYQFDGEMIPDRWTADGKYYDGTTENGLDLIGVKPERDVWIVWRRTDNFNYFTTHNIKPTPSECPNAVAMKRVVIAEGEGIA